MKPIAIRLSGGDDLKRSIAKIAADNLIKAGCIINAVGSLEKAIIRLAGARKNIKLDKDLEIISLIGTVSTNGLHIHIAVSDEDGKVYGGDLRDGCIVRTTTELAIAKFDSLNFKREPDQKTGFDELVIRKVK